MAIRAAYEKHGVTQFYKEFSNDYENPHENEVKKIIEFAHKNWKVDFSKTLDLAAGNGEVTRALQRVGEFKIDAVDPFTFALYEKTTEKKCLPISFEDILQGALDGKRYSTIVCSFALHLAEIDKLPMLCWKLSQISDSLVIITPHKRPAIKEEWGWKLDQEVVIDRVRGRLYKHVLIA